MVAKKNRMINILINFCKDRRFQKSHKVFLEANYKFTKPRYFLLHIHNTMNILIQKVINTAYVHFVQLTILLQLASEFIYGAYIFNNMKGHFPCDVSKTLEDTNSKV